MSLRWASVVGAGLRGARLVAGRLVFVGSAGGAAADGGGVPVVAGRAAGAPVGAIVGCRAVMRDGGRRPELPARGGMGGARGARTSRGAGLDVGASCRAAVRDGGRRPEVPARGGSCRARAARKPQGSGLDAEAVAR
ncbi:hypothetical protein [Streptomyces sp. NPDC050759]|uniref:hypothetical protein n=1 Tax=Streptomyces sp. NPDC050759 TaxID=3365635 RepID=UPI0037963E38